MGDKIISFILVSIIIAILTGIGIFGYMVYTEIIGEAIIEINFDGDSILPIIEYKSASKDKINVVLDEDLFSGVNGTNTSEETGNKTQSRYLYNQLNTTGKIIYNQLYKNKENMKTGTYVVKFGNAFQTLLSSENGDIQLKKDYQSAIEALVYENPDMFYLDVTKMYINIEKTTKITGTTYNVFIDYGNEICYLADGYLSKEDVEKYETKIVQVKNQILAQLEGKSNYQKIKLVHDYLIDTIEYEKDLRQCNIYDIYGALISRRCVCEGYAKTFQYIMNEVGIENVIVIGVATNSKNETENHAWNYVKLDEKWYAIDVTWDDPIITDGGSLTNKAKYEYFLKGSNTMNQNHIPSGKFTAHGKVFEYPELSVEDYK